MNAAPIPSSSRALALMINHHLGNFVVSLPFLDAIAAPFNQPVDLVVDSRYACLAQLLPHGGNVIPYRQHHRRNGKLRQAADFATLIHRLKTAHYDVVFDVGGGIQSVTFTTLTFSRHRIGLETSRRSWMYTERLPPDSGTHVSDRFTPFMTRLGLPKAGRLRLKPPADAFARLNGQLPEILRAPGLRLAVMHGGAGYEFRQWPKERFAKTADVLIAERGMGVVFIGAPGEQAFLDSLLGLMKHRDRAAHVIGELDVVLALLDRAAILISNESGPTHLAATTDVPIVTIFGPSKESNWRPVREENLTILRGAACPPECRWGQCKHGLKCVMNVSVENVLTATSRYL
ncbi:MAG: glycosyltransferase family 9 protein [bacterium]